MSFTPSAGQLTAWIRRDVVIDSVPQRAGQVPALDVGELKDLTSVSGKHAIPPPGYLDRQRVYKESGRRANDSLTLGGLVMLILLDIASALVFLAIVAALERLLEVLNAFADAFPHLGQALCAE